MYLSPHFTLEELCHSARAEEAGITNIATHPRVIENLTDLAENILEPVRDFMGPFSPTSGYRSPALNRLIGGSDPSQHSKGQAGDLVANSHEGLHNYGLAVFIFENTDFDQLILEKVTEEIPTSGWIHVSYVSFRKSRNEVLYFDGKKYHKLDWNLHG